MADFSDVQKWAAAKGHPIGSSPGVTAGEKPKVAIGQSSVHASSKLIALDKRSKNPYGLGQTLGRLHEAEAATAKVKRSATVTRKKIGAKGKIGRASGRERGYRGV